MKKTGEFIVHIIFFLLGLIMVGCVLLISGYLVISGIPAIREMGFGTFYLGRCGLPPRRNPNSAFCRLS